jgi:hypothetical protein
LGTVSCNEGELVYGKLGLVPLDAADRSCLIAIVEDKTVRRRVEQIRLTIRDLKCYARIAGAKCVDKLDAIDAVERQSGYGRLFSVEAPNFRVLSPVPQLE